MKDLPCEQQLFSSKGGSKWIPHLDGNPRSDISDWLYQNLTWDEFQDIVNPPKSEEELQAIETTWRNAELSSTDEFGLNDYPDNDLRTSMREYRQLLRDYPSVEGFGDSSLRPVDPRN